MRYYLYISMLIIFFLSGCSTKIKRNEMREIAFNNGFSQKCVDKFIDLNNSEDIDTNELLNLMNNLVDCKKIYN